MEKLTEDQRLKVMKMRDKRLRRKLIQAGYKEVDILGLDRSTLISFVAQVLLAETAYVPVGTEGETEYGDGEGDDDGDGEEEVAVAVGGEMQAEEINVSLEERRLILEERKLEEQRKQREEQTKQRLLEEKRWQFEQQKWKEEE